MDVEISISFIKKIEIEVWQRYPHVLLEEAAKFAPCGDCSCDISEYVANSVKA